MGTLGCDNLIGLAVIQCFSRGEDLVSMITLTKTLTLVMSAVSAFCWGSFADLCNFMCVSCITFRT